MILFRGKKILYALKDKETGRYVGRLEYTASGDARHLVLNNEIIYMDIGHIKHLIDQMLEYKIDIKNLEILAYRLTETPSPFKLETIVQDASKKLLVKKLKG